MSGKYTIIIYNKSGNTQSYAVFAQPAPTTGSGSCVSITSSIIISLSAIKSGTDKDTRYALFQLSKDLYAVCGKKDPNGSGSEVVDSRMVQVQNDATQRSGTSLGVAVVEKTPAFSEHLRSAETSEAAGVVNDGCFTVRTQQDFFAADANNLKYFIGYTSSIPHTATYSAFTPTPNTMYEIKPLNCICVLVGNYEAGSVVNDDHVQGPAATADFDRFGDTVTFEHLGNGKIAQRENPPRESIPSFPEGVTKGKIIHERY